MGDWWSITPTANVMEVIGFIICLFGLVMGLIAYGGARQDYQRVRRSGINGMILVVAWANVRGAQSRILQQSLLIIMIANFLTLPSRYAWQSTLSSLIVVGLSITVAYRIVVTARLRRRLLRMAERDDA